MGAMKALAIELERKQEASGDGHAFVLGILAAAEIILQAREPFTGEFDSEALGAWRSLSNAFSMTMDAASYLSDTLCMAHANGPAVGD